MNPQKVRQVLQPIGHSFRTAYRAQIAESNSLTLSGCPGWIEAPHAGGQLGHLVINTLIAVLGQLELPAVDACLLQRWVFAIL